jgi:hypothetical protein
MVSAFFCCHNIDMDIDKLMDKIFEDEDLQDIPIDYIFRVTYAIMTIIGAGECFYKDDF